MVENSPRSLMASLQLGIGSSPAAGIWKVRTNDLAVEEVLLERRAAIVDGRLKGRRLFHDDQTETEDGGWEGFADFVYCNDSHCDITGYQDEHKGQGEEEGEGVSEDCSSSSSSSFVCDECMKKAVMDVERRDREDTTNTTTTTALALVPVNPEKRWSPAGTVLMVCVAIGFLIVAGLIIIPIRHCCRRGYGDQVLVPT